MTTTQELLGAPEVVLALPAGAPPPGVLVLGVGNLLMGDEGVGIHILRQLERKRPIPGARLLDGGTGGINLLIEFEGADDIVMIDATRDGRPAGTITFLQPESVSALPRGLGAHDFGLRDLFAAAALLGPLPRIHLFTIAVEEVKPMCTQLSEAVAAAVPDVVYAAHALAVRLVARANEARSAAASSGLSSGLLASRSEPVRAKSEIVS